MGDTTVHEPLRLLGFDEGGIRWLVKTFSMSMLREWTDIALAAKERFTLSFFKKSPQAWLVDNLKSAAAGRRTPPDWWDQLRREESRALAKARSAVKLPVGDTPDVPENSRDAYEKVTADMFSIFMANGQPEGVARANAEKFAQECTNRGDTGLAEPLLRLLKS